MENHKPTRAQICCGLLREAGRMVHARAPWIAPFAFAAFFVGAPILAEVLDNRAAEDARRAAIEAAVAEALAGAAAPLASIPPRPRPAGS